MKYTFSNLSSNSYPPRKYPLTPAEASSCYKYFSHIFTDGSKFDVVGSGLWFLDYNTETYFANNPNSCIFTVECLRICMPGGL